MTPTARILLYLVRTLQHRPPCFPFLWNQSGGEVWLVYLPDGSSRLSYPWRGDRTGVLQLQEPMGDLPSDLECLTPETLLEWIQQADMVGVWG